MAFIDVVGSRIATVLRLTLALVGAGLGLVHAAEGDGSSTRVLFSWGHESPAKRAFYLRLSGSDVSISDLQLQHGELGDQLQDKEVQTQAGGGDTDEVSGLLRFTPRAIQASTNVQQIWRYLLQNTEVDAARRLRADPAMRPDPRRLIIQCDKSGARGFTLTVDQLLTQQSFWFPEFDLYVAVGDPPISLAAHQVNVSPQRGRRVLDRAMREPEATYSDFTARWEDMGSPSYRNPHSVSPGHVVGLTWDSALYKYGVDRWGEVRNDYGKEDVFHFRLSWPGSENSNPSQRLTDGLPILTTTFNHDGVRLEVEQFAYPLLGPPPSRRGDIPMVLFERVRIFELEGKSRVFPLALELTREPARVVFREEEGGQWLGTETETWLAVQNSAVTGRLEETTGKTQTVRYQVALPSNGQREFVIKLPSPAVRAEERATLLALNYPQAREATIQFWTKLLAQGASFEVPDAAVNSLFRANLWHALCLPRRHGGGTISNVVMDLPYSNFAYDQKGTPWPVNQAVYVDYMLYDLRGYHDTAAEELAVIYRNNQEPNGHVGGFANWGVYTPSMMYSVAQHYLLSGQRGTFESLLPPTLRALDWCLGEIQRTTETGASAPGLMLAPLNDLTHEARSWAFNQAYFVAGFDKLGQALAAIGHPRAAECRTAADALRRAIAREFGRASVQSPAVQLADGTWSSYVPTDAQAAGRLFQVWYPTDVDVGPLHLLRLGGLDARSGLAEAILNDHEDNLFLKQWGTINEPVYNMQGTAYLLRDEPKLAIRTFFSTLACAFSHSVFQPVEHRWAWGQYFGPPSTDGAWFELYRNLLVREQDESSLILCQAAPRAWFENGKRIQVQRAPTYFGPVSFTVQGGENQTTASIQLSDRNRPATLFVRFREPQQRPIRTVSVNDAAWTDFDVAREWVRIPHPSESSYRIVAHY